MKVFTLLVVLVVFIQCLGWTAAIGNCREDQVCLDDPKEEGQTCRCWSTCSPVQGGRKCDKVSPQWTGYNRTNLGGNDIGCGYYPGVSNARDMCVWYYKEEPEDSDKALFT
uniref:Secreted protein n=1 Tax=Aplanochytrium stocchinoi TaxID=215587 RepID=A0A7S3LPE4_9STRA|mmetsp:Transcript_19559/g.23769  ORF Transcript_19559/g.23769 Transcript_19559/m.23769 type:complete len:111 (+) Transcript_19559:154-486(+)|eukprot:CAMPEP_0204843768 /NCGR_PEP_ID=MMETSP1346-20131115/48173_1 /ASSEMBLY_ACC=CAM_ASM_000771 /TAXON_ID=215587 /ORGANISM="Aplanochytrium stocchinoi, Strain GSBS06" /LENGTH=110 /DNA_ID=CAMNT_0051982969 /DNA_START=631 /DNA_END=963 /DNA_ORIENTATION=-